LRYYSEGGRVMVTDGAYGNVKFANTGVCVVRRCRLTPVESRVETDWFQCLKPKYDDPLSNFAFNFNLRRYSVDDAEGAGCDAADARAPWWGGAG
jgi:hypothetical protein